MQDRALCNHVLSVHQTGHAPERTDTVELLDAATLRSYIAKAKQFNPHIPEELTGILQTAFDHIDPACKALVGSCCPRAVPGSARGLTNKTVVYVCCL